MTDRHDFTVFSPAEASASGGDARRYVRQARSAALATLDAKTKAPLVTLVALATDSQGDPILLLSQLARHTKNLAADASASLLISNPEGNLDPMTTLRVTVQGPIRHETGADVAERFLGWQAEAAGYAGFSDFGFYRLAVEGVHAVAGFGRIQSSLRDDYLMAERDCLTLTPAELDDIASQCEAGLARRWKSLTGQDGVQQEPVRLVLADGDGCVLRQGNTVARLTFTAPITSASDLMRALKA